jgi:hypothetical protein
VTAAAALVALPPGARALELWFENSDPTGCVAWDSRYGNNYLISLP